MATLRHRLLASFLQTGKVFFVVKNRRSDEQMNYQLEDYIDLFKQFVMENLNGDKKVQLRQYMFQLIKENTAQYEMINSAFLIVRKEVIGI